MIVLEDLKDFDTWKRWKNNEVKLMNDFPTKPGFVEKRIDQMINIAAEEEYEQYSEGMSDREISIWKHGFICGGKHIFDKK